MTHARRDTFARLEQFPSSCALRRWCPQKSKVIQVKPPRFVKAPVLKPPGGGSSDLFGADNQPQTPRSMNKNRMQSNIFAVPEGQRAGNGETPRRAANGQDSHNRLFGEVDRPYTPAKNHMKSNLPIGAGGGDQPDSNGKSSATNGHSNGHSAAAKTNGHQNGNGNHANGHSNGHSNGTSSSTNGHSNGTSSAAPSQNGSTHRDVSGDHPAVTVIFNSTTATLTRGRTI
ncbi:hypothetical protein pipiens_005569 [Culex pipiens pipiens]|uniref:Microtubule-associated protein Jupiter n=1 Tax=Culex pipiens pipiens TaxID=38569 RepID=A0ABD1DXZ9_CULPP